MAVWCDPDSGKVVGVDFVFRKVTAAIFVDVYSTRLTVMNLALDDRWIGARFHLETRDSIVVDVVSLEITLLVEHKEVRQLLVSMTLT